MIKIMLFSILLLVLVSCKKEESKYFDSGKVKYINILDGNIIEFKRFDEQGNLMFTGKFKNEQLIDTLFAYGEDEFFIKIDSSDNNYFYGKYISKYSTGNDAKISLLRFNKGLDIDSVISSSLLFGKETIYLPNGKKARETIYEIKGNTSKILNVENYDSIR